MKKIEIIKPDDFHLHLRDDQFMASVVNHSSTVFSRAIIMPNITPPATTVILATEYKKRIEENCNTKTFTPLMTLYLTDNTSPEEIKRAIDSKIIHAIKLYPAGATTNSDFGVTDIKKCYKTLEEMQRCGIPLSIHCESTDQRIDIFDREKAYIDTELEQIIRDFPELKVVCEHATTKDMVNFVKEQSNFIASTITPHHLILTRNDIFNHGINPHNYCLPIAKTYDDRESLIKAAISGDPKFFAGTDSAPHPISNKEKENGSAGIYNAYCALEAYAEVFDNNKSIDRLESFTSIFGAKFYNLPANKDKISLIREEWKAPQKLPFGDGEVKPFLSEKNLKWKVDGKVYS